MPRGLRSPIGVVIALFLVAGCGASGPAASSPGGGGPTGAAGSPTTAPTEPAGATGGAPEPSGGAVEPTNAGPTQGSGAGGGVCSLVTAAELDGIFGTSGITTTVIQGPPDTCDIQEEGAPVAAFVLTPAGGRMIFDIRAAGGDAESVGGLGDAAFYSAETMLLVIAKGDAMLSIAVYPAGVTPERHRELQDEIGAVAAGRM